MSRQDLTTDAADRLVRLEADLRDHRLVLPAAAAVSAAAVTAHAVFDAQAGAWLALVMLAVAGLAVGLPAVWVAGAAAIGFGVADVVVDEATASPLTPLLRAGGLMASTIAAAGVGVVLRRYEETRRRNREEDSITGLLNVRAFYDALRALRDADVPYAILIADIAGMRGLNEQYGHVTGTEAMRALGHVLRRVTKREDLLARLGSDEVAVALVGADRDGALAAARRLSAQLAEETVTLPDGQAFRVHAYYGCAASVDIPDQMSLLRAADHARLAAKQHGPDEIGLAPDTDDAHVEIHHPAA